MGAVGSTEKKKGRGVVNTPSIFSWERRYVHPFSLIKIPRRVEGGGSFSGREGSSWPRIIVL